jgi:NADPH:quinone reductase-like Zn-dependent oxidoreductase
VGVPFVAAWSALVVAGEIRAGDTILITGASGAVGRAATQIAHWKNARVIRADIIEDSQPSTDPFINTKTMDLPVMVAALTENKGVSLVLDAVGGPMFEASMKSMDLDGRHVVITSVGSRRVEFDLVDFYHSRQRLIGVDTAKLTGVEIAGILNELRPGFESGALKPSPVKTWPLEKVVTAYEAVAAGDALAKHILKPKEI